jgi:hypothetical protein
LKRRLDSLLPFKQGTCVAFGKNCDIIKKQEVNNEHEKG